VKRIVITGGPCAGKTTGLNYIREKLSNSGFSVIIVPEVATHVITSGLTPISLPESRRFFFQELVADTQDMFELIGERALRVRGGDESRMILLCDRGKMDIKAYMSDEGFQLLLEMKNATVVDWRDKRYDGVFHLITAADGKEEYYTLENNRARFETPEEARARDLATRNAWLGHPHFRVIDNSTLFEGKMKRLLADIQRLLGIPVVLEIERRFLVHTPGVWDRIIPVPFVKVEIEQAYLEPQPAGHGRIRRRKQDGSVYYRTFKIPAHRPGVHEEREEQITPLDFYELMKIRDRGRDVLLKDRYCFLWENQYFELDVFKQPERLRGLTILEIELTEENSDVELPNWLGKVTEITGNPDFSNYNLALSR